MAGSFSKADGLPDALNNNIGKLGRAIYSQSHFNSQSMLLKARLIECLSKQRYIALVSCI